MKKIIITVGTRPNFIKLASLVEAMKKYEYNYKIVHTKKRIRIRFLKTDQQKNRVVWPLEMSQTYCIATMRQQVPNGFRQPISNTG